MTSQKDIDPPTKLILEGIARMGIKITKREEKTIDISPEDFTKFWSCINKFTLTLMSGIHYNHYIAASKDKFSTKILSQQLTVMARSGVLPETWSVGLKVMLEK
jgi:hypothetical protein